MAQQQAISFQKQTMQLIFLVPFSAAFNTSFQKQTGYAIRHLYSPFQCCFQCHVMRDSAALIYAAEADCDESFTTTPHTMRFQITMVKERFSYTENILQVAHRRLKQGIMSVDSPLQCLQALPFFHASRDPIFNYMSQPLSS